MPAMCADLADVCKAIRALPAAQRKVGAKAQMYGAAGTAVASDNIEAVLCGYQDALLEPEV